VFNGFYINFLAGIQIQKKTQYMPLVSGLGAIVNVLANFLLIPELGMLGAAYATLLAYLSMAIFQYFLSQKFYKIHYELRKIFLIGLSTILSYGLFYILSDYKILNIYILKILSVLLFVILLELFGLIEIKWLKEFFQFLMKKVEI
jgi:O-antigen/teichoic acid export membrane protein